MVAPNPALEGSRRAGAPTPPPDHPSQPTARRDRQRLILYSNLAPGPRYVALAMTTNLPSGSNHPRWYGTDKTLASMTGFSRQTALGHRRELEARGVLVRTGRQSDSGAVEYWFRFDALNRPAPVEATRNPEHQAAKGKTDEVRAEVSETFTLNEDEVHTYLARNGVKDADLVTDTYTTGFIETAALELEVAKEAGRTIRNPTGYLLGILRRIDPTRWTRLQALRRERKRRKRARERGPRHIRDAGATVGVSGNRIGGCQESRHIQAREHPGVSKEHLVAKPGFEGGGGQTRTGNDPSACRTVPVDGTVPSKPPVPLYDMTPEERRTYILREINRQNEGEDPQTA